MMRIPFNNRNIGLLLTTNNYYHYNNGFSVTLRSGCTNAGRLGGLKSYLTIYLCSVASVSTCTIKVTAINYVPKM